MKDTRYKGIATASDNQLYDERVRRQRQSNPFPLHVFSDRIKPYIEALVKEYDLPKAYVGLTLLSAYSTAIGTSYTVSTNGKEGRHLPVWSALLGMSSSGKSLAFNLIYKPLQQIQRQYKQDWDVVKANVSRSNLVFERRKYVIYRDAHVPTLTRSVLPDNPKGVCKWSDELLEWINGLNQLSRKEGTDEQFWLSTWNCATYDAMRSGKESIDLDRPFVNVTGGLQYAIIPKLFANDRDTTGFVFRMLFAVPEEDRGARPNRRYSIPDDLAKIHHDSLTRLHYHLPMEDTLQDPKMLVIHPDALRLMEDWEDYNADLIDMGKDIDDKSIKHGIFGKIKEYAERFAAILHLSDIALREDKKYHDTFSWRDEDYITADTVRKAIALADYFYKSALHVYELYHEKAYAPAEVHMIANLWKKGKSASDIAQIHWQDDSPAAKHRMLRLIKKYLIKYPKTFNSKEL